METENNSSSFGHSGGRTGTGGWQAGQLAHPHPHPSLSSGSSGSTPGIQRAGKAGGGGNSGK